MDKELKLKLLRYLLPYRPSRIGVFGSFARGENNKNSDLDVLIEFNDRISLLKLVQIEQELAEKLGMPVELITSRSIKNLRLKSYIEQDLITIYG